ncbi:MAG: hypothetical protein LAQ30_02395 [Acidobacteriia bacterium]|nr:hypothetical protein [Terriglobia bacterium]
MNPGDVIFVSASVPYRDGWTQGSFPAEIEEAIVALARATFARGGRLLFGGHPSVSYLIASVAGEYFEPEPSRRARPVITFQSEFFRKVLPDETWLLYRMGWSSIEWTPEVIRNGQRDRDASLWLMRKQMLLGPELPEDVKKKHGLTPPKAMAVIGGMEGVLEEAQMFLDHIPLWNEPRPPRIYSLPSGGGAAERLLRTDAPALAAARRGGLILDAEDYWKEHHPGVLPEDVPLKPYSSIVQFMLDHLQGIGPR